ncbi:molybdopterin molybdotransferase MoeA [Roseiflexus castenholzii]|jgi:molybdopterin molybdotransferase|uniref:Molybdopterin molybdenumtransferase n=1 Tax=Roseiflexus castenholzii (strain DSM 13941 / HLO8) TaxID=383372 RepID=A7NH58_ROSCS|nr:gephyrin-like molybdotransferase Glp [Roseiflexus castenholzii]ABU56805.1 molybdenum cofactor synthesis domain [Roseiflexus castenholzii DSM 13941]
MQRESPYPMVSVDEAQRLITAHITPLDVEVIDVLHESADGRVLAEDVYGIEPLPDVPKAGVDGYALRSADGDAPRRVIAEVTAGATPGLRVEAGSAVRIMTGAPVPEGADAVIAVERTEERDGVLIVQHAPRAGDNIHTIGQDIAAGQLVLARGTALGAAEIGLLATVGRTRAMVYRRPVVAVLSTGDEVYEPDGEVFPGGVRDSNRYALMAAVREAGCLALSLGIARDDVNVQRAAILEALDRADVLLTSGGVSMGTRDLIKPLLAELGTVHFGRIAFKPGKPTTFATIERPNSGRLLPLLTFGLPGYPVSSLVSFEVFVRPALRRLQGDARPDRPQVRVTLRDPISPSPDRPEYQRAIVSWEDGRLMARSTGRQGSSRLLSMLGANALLIVPAGTEAHPAGAELDALMTGPLAPQGMSVL